MLCLFNEYLNFYVFGEERVYFLKHNLIKHKIHGWTNRLKLQILLSRMPVCSSTNHLNSVRVLLERFELQISNLVHIFPLKIKCLPIKAGQARIH